MSETLAAINLPFGNGLDHPFMIILRTLAYWVYHSTGCLDVADIEAAKPSCSMGRQRANRRLVIRMCFLQATGSPGHLHGISAAKWCGPKRRRGVANHAWAVSKPIGSSLILGVFLLKREHSTHCWDSYDSHGVHWQISWSCHFQAHPAAPNGGTMYEEGYLDLPTFEH